MLRICYCLSHYHPIASGAERQAHLQAREMVRRGHQARVLTRAVPGQPEFERLDGVEVHRLIRPREMGPGFGASFVATLASGLWRLRREFDIVHCHQSLWEAVASGIMAPMLGKPSVVQPAAGGEYGEIHQLGRTRGRALLRRLILRNSRFVAISAQIAQELTGLGVPPDRLTQLASGVDTAAFSPGASAVDAALPPRPRVLFVGRLHPQKNLHTLLAAWPAVRRQVPASLILAGDGPEAADLRARAERLECAQSVHFVGPVDDPAEYLRAADLFVLPSVAEGMSNSLLEAMSVGLPVLVSQIGGNQDLVKHDVTGLCVPPSDDAHWSAAMLRLLTSPEACSRLGAAARQLVTDRYSIQAVVDRYVDLYLSLARSSG